MGHEGETMRAMRVALAVGIACALAGGVFAGGAGRASAQYIAPGAPPSYGTLAIRDRFAPDPMVADGVAGGRVSLSDVNGSCRGYSQEAPSHIVMAQTPIRWLAIMVNASFDSTLFVQTPDGQIYCNDDTDGLQPRVEISSPPGPIRIWVGAYSSSGGGPYRLGLSGNPSVRGGQLGAPGMPGGGMRPGIVVAPPPGSMLAPGARPLYGDVAVRAGFRPDPAILTGSAGGAIRGDQVDPSCRGYYTPEPTHVVMAQSGFPNLRFVVQADHDTTLLVQYPDGRIACNDDGGGSLNPLVEGPTGPGPIRVWVGSYSSGRAGPYTLGVTQNPGLTFAMLGAGGPPPGGIVVAPPPPPPGGGIVVRPPVGATVDLQPRIPVTLYDAAMGTAQVAVWSPRGGPRVEIGVVPSGGSLAISANVGGVPMPVFEVPAEVARDAAVSVRMARDGTLILRAERPAGAGDPGALLLLQIGWPAGASAPDIAQQWQGTMRDRLPRWGR